MSLYKILLKNIFHVLIFLCPFVICCVFVINSFDNVLLKIIISIIMVLICFSMMPVIDISIKLVCDIFCKKTETVSSKVEGLVSAWTFSSAGVKRKYLLDVFRSNYTCIYCVYLSRNNKYLKTYYFIPRKELEKTNFFNLYELSYKIYKEELILQKNHNVEIKATATYYKFSKIIKEIKFYI